MAAKSAIEWTDATWPIVQGCDYESPGCANCYAVPLIWRLAHNPNPKISAPLHGLVEKNAAGVLHWTGKVALRADRLADPIAWKAPRRIFVPSHGDIFHEDVPDDFLDQIFAVMALCPQHTFQVLTKRATRMHEYFTGDVERRSAAASTLMVPIDADNAVGMLPPNQQSKHIVGWGDWPLPNVWLGVSVEDQTRADKRIPLLLETPAAKRFLSCEPLLGPLNLTRCGNHYTTSGPLHLWKTDLPGNDGWRKQFSEPVPQVDWVIVGGESGQDARPMHPDWARSLRDQCQAAGVPFFFKQWGEYRPPNDQIEDACGVTRERAGTARHSDCRFLDDGKIMLKAGKKAAGRMLDGRDWSEFPLSAEASAKADA